MKKMVSLMMSAALVLTSIPVQVYAEDVDTEIVAEETELVTEERTAPATDIQDVTETCTEWILLSETEKFFDVESEDVLVTQPETEVVSETGSENNTEAWSEVPTEAEQESEMVGIAQPESELLSESERMTEEDTEQVSEPSYIEDEELIIEEGTDISYGIEQIDLENMGVMAAEEDAATGFTYELLEDGTAEITGYTRGLEGDLIIPDEVDGHKVTKIGDYAFEGCSGFTGELKLPEGLTSIGYVAFRDCSGFTGDLNIPEGVTNIEDYAFCGCEGFTGELKLPKGLTSIGWEAFGACSGFTGELTLPEGLTSIGDYAFYNCDGFTGGLVIPEGVTSIGDYVFCGCEGFTGELKLPKGLASIGDSTFKKCNFTRELKLPEGVISIGVDAFYGCGGFTGELKLPDGLQTIGYCAFYGYNREIGCSDFDIPDDGQAKLYVGMQIKLYVGSNDLQWKIPAISWKSSDDNVLVIDENGVINVVGTGEATISVTACDGVEYEKEVCAVENQCDFYTLPNIEKFEDVWVGDTLTIGMNYAEEWEGNVIDIAVLNGKADVKMYRRYGEVTLSQAGALTLKITYIDHISCKETTKTLEIDVKERPVDVKIDESTPIKLGDGIENIIGIASEYLPYGIMPTWHINDEDVENFYIHYTHGVLGGGLWPYDSRSGSLLLEGYDSDRGHSIYVHGAVYPGKVKATFNMGSLSKTCTLTIAEPIITTNEKAVSLIGESLNFEARLTNTDYPDIGSSELETMKNIPYIYYIPKLEIISGSDCCELEGSQTLTTLSLKQGLKFVKAGTVQLKITFVPSGEDAPLNKVYQPEKIITINVVDELETEAPETEPQEQPDTPETEPQKQPDASQTEPQKRPDTPQTEPQKQTEAPAAEVKVSSITITTTDLSVQKGKTLQLTAEVEPENAKNKALVWSSSDTSVAAVSGSGVVTGKKYGTATITAKAADGSGKSVQCKVTVGYGITYKLNSGKNSTKNPRAYYKSAVKLQNPTRKGYLFKGWYTDKKYKKKITKIASSSKKNLTLYAKWEKVKTGKVAISSLKNAAGKKATLKFKKVSKASGYEILYGTAKNLKGAETLTTKKTTVTLKGLEKGKTYYAKVRAYRMDSAGNKVYGKYSGVKTVKITK